MCKRIHRVKQDAADHRAKQINANLAKDFESMKGDALVILTLDSSMTIEGRSAGDMGALVSRADGTSLALVDVDAWKKYDGQKITVAVHAADMWYPSDVAGALYTVTAKNAALIAPLTQESADSAIKASGLGNFFIIRHLFFSIIQKDALKGVLILQ